MIAVPTPSLLFGKVGATEEPSSPLSPQSSLPPVMGAPKPSPGQTPSSEQHPPLPCLQGGETCNPRLQTSYSVRPPDSDQSCQSWSLSDLSCLVCKLRIIMVPVLSLWVVMGVKIQIKCLHPPRQALSKWYQWLLQPPWVLLCLWPFSSQRAVPKHRNTVLQEDRRPPPLASFWWRSLHSHPLTPCCCIPTPSPHRPRLCLHRSSKQYSWGGPGGPAQSSAVPLRVASQLCRAQAAWLCSSGILLSACHLQSPSSMPLAVLRAQARPSAPHSDLSPQSPFILSPFHTPGSAQTSPQNI